MSKRHRACFLRAETARCTENEKYAEKRVALSPIAVGRGQLLCLKCVVKADLEGAAAYFSSQMGSFSIQRPYSSL